MQRRGFTALTAVQQAVLDSEAEGRNLRISSQTGSGKTLAIGFALADDLLDNPDPQAPGPVALLITPTRELAAQVQGELKWLLAETNLNVGVVTGGTDVMRERRRLAKRPDILVGTPGRVLDHLRSGAFKCTAVRHVILDEADQMLDMGFRDELSAIVEQMPEIRRSHLVSATFPNEVQSFADAFQKDALHLEGTQLGVANADIEHVAYIVRNREQYAALVNSLLLLDGARCLVFVRRRTDAAELAELLASDGFSALPFSGDLPQGQRTRTLNAFRHGIVKTLVATDVAARGIDVADIAMVIHASAPSDADVYIHRSGRTGRAGNKGRSVLLVPPAAERRVRRLLQTAKISPEWATLPTPKKVKKTIIKRARRQLHRELRDESPRDEAELTYAQGLLEQHDPAQLVAHLLERAMPKLPREPMEVSALQPWHDRDPQDRGRDRPRRGKRPFGRRKRFGNKSPRRGGPRRTRRDNKRH